MSDDKKSRQVEILYNAMKAEFEGHHFYTMAAKTCADPKGKETFARLSEEELDHYEYLKGQIESVRTTGAVDGSLKLKGRLDLVGASPIFSEAIRERISDAHFEMTALAVGAQLEKDAEAYYRKAAQEEDDPALSAIYLELAQWESGHYRALLAQQDNLKEDYWAQSGFSPF